MNKEEKAAAVAELSERLKEVDSIFAVDYRGISVPGAADLRGRLAEADATFKVVKNRLAKRAAEDAGTEGLADLLDGPTALTLIKGDPVIAAKAISAFSREHEVLAYKGGILDGKPLDPEQFTTISRLPGLDVLRGQLVGMTASPLTGLVRGLASLVGGLASQLGQIQEQGLVSGEAAPVEAAEAEAPAQEDAQAEEPAEEAPADEEEQPPAQEEAPADEEEQPPAQEEAPAEVEEASVENEDGQEE